MNDEDGAGGSSKSNSITSEHSLHSTGISASSQGSSTNSLPKGVPIPPNGGPGPGAGLGAGQPHAHSGHHQLSGQVNPVTGNAGESLLAQSHDGYGVVVGSASAPGGHGGQHLHHTPTSFHRSTLSQSQGGPSPSLSAKSKLSQVTFPCQMSKAPIRGLGSKVVDGNSNHTIFLITAPSS